MAERRFAALADLKKRPAVAETIPPEFPLEPAVSPDSEAPRVPSLPVSVEVPPALQTAPVAHAAVERGRGRPPGKRSDPDWKPRTILMRTKTHRRVSGLLLERDDSPDLSELVDQLLGEWISKHS